MTAHEKNVVMAVFDELVRWPYSELNKHLGSITIQEMTDLYHRLKYEDYCKQYGKDYDDMTEDDWMILQEQIAAEEEARAYRDWEDQQE